MSLSPAATAEPPLLLEAIQKAPDLRTVEDLLTQVMAQQRIQALIKGENLDLVAESIMGLADQVDPASQLLAAAMLGRLAAVARGREARVFGHVSNLFSGEPPSIETLANGDEKSYAAQSLRHVNAEWLADYCVREAVEIDSADNARKELLSTALIRQTTMANWLRAIAGRAKLLRAIENQDTQLKRVRRLFASMLEAIRGWQGELGEEPGLALAQCLGAFVRGNLENADQAALFDALDHILAVLARMIEMRFSHALHADTYAAIEQSKKSVGSSIWAQFLSESRVMPSLHVDLLEAALVLARQNRTDKRIMTVMTTAFTSRSQISAAIKRHFSEARDLDPDVREWWLNSGAIADSQRKVEHKVGNTEDQQIGALLIEVEVNRESMEKLSRAVVPLLEISDPVLASTVKKAAAGYTDMAQIARRLARMRKLTKTDLRGERMEYNPLEHEMLGGHRPGIRMIKVVRDGIKKEFGGRVKTLVKPWVEPDE